MSIFKLVKNWIQLFFEGAAPRSDQERKSQPALPSITFPKVIMVENAPNNNALEPGKIYCVAPLQIAKWVIFVCPCGCRDIITLSLQEIHNPHWSLSKSSINLPTLYPSIWRDKGCFSHFWLKEGRVFWCPDTGSDPRLRKMSR